MSSAATGRTDQPPRYEIRLAGRLAPRWAPWFDGLTLTHQPDGTTVLAGPVVDQSALHGLLLALRDIGLPLLSVTRIEPTLQPTSPRETP